CAATRKRLRPDENPAAAGVFSCTPPCERRHIVARGAWLHCHLPQPAGDARGGMTGMTVRARLVLGFSLVIALLVASMAMGIAQLHVLGSGIDGLAQERLPKLSLSGKVVETLLQGARHMRNAL